MPANQFLKLKFSIQIQMIIIKYRLIFIIKKTVFFPSFAKINAELKQFDNEICNSHFDNAVKKIQSHFENSIFLFIFLESPKTTY